MKNHWVVTSQVRTYESLKLYFGPQEILISK